MANKNKLLNNFSDAQVLESALWSSFIDAERKASFGPLNLLKLFRARRTILRKNKFLVRNFPWFITLSIFFGVLSLGTRVLTQEHERLVYWSVLFAYSCFLTLAIFNKDRFVKALVQHEIPLGKPAYNAFELKNASLLIHYLFEGVKAYEPKLSLSKVKIDNLVKLVKASQDYAGTQYGYYDYARKGFIALVATLPLTAVPGILKAKDQFNIYWPKALAYFLAEDLWVKTVIVGWLISTVGLGLYFLYWVSFGGPTSDRKKKRYLLALTALQCSWEE